MIMAIRCQVDLLTISGVDYNITKKWAASAVEKGDLETRNGLSSEITIDEVKEIRENTKIVLFLNIFGYLPMFTSIRPVINNYLKTFDIKGNSKIHYMEMDNKYLNY